MNDTKLGDLASVVHRLGEYARSTSLQNDYPALAGDLIWLRERVGMDEWIALVDALELLRQQPPAA